MSTQIQLGNATDDGAPNRGWFIGRFMPPDDLRRTSCAEVKWGIHPAGQQRGGWGVSGSGTTLSLLVSGRFRLITETDSFVLSRSGDYIIMPPGTRHHWEAELDSCILTVRWPSEPDTYSNQPEPTPGSQQNETHKR